MLVSRPPHLPIFLALSMVPIIESRIDPRDSIMTQLRPLTTSLDPPETSPVPEIDQDSVLKFTRRVYGDLVGKWPGVDKYRGEFKQLNLQTDGHLGETINALLDFRMLDLQASVKRAKRMREVIDDLASKQAHTHAI